MTGENRMNVKKNLARLERSKRAKVGVIVPCSVDLFRQFNDLALNGLRGRGLESLEDCRRLFGRLGVCGQVSVSGLRLIVS
jgi:hypothetical protein